LAYLGQPPIQNTIEQIKTVITNLHKWQFDIICVNDGSSDGTATILASLPGITVVTHHVNRGYGAALRTGLDLCQHEWVFITDADSTYPIADLKKLIDEAEKGADMVVGARRGEGINAKPLHIVARWLLRKMAHSLSGVMVPDLNSGMRLFKHKLYREFRNILPMGFSFTTTITLAALYNNYRTIYVPIEYAERVGRSNIKPISDFFAFTLLIVRIAAYFEPLRFFMPVSLVIATLGLFKGTIDFVNLGAIGSLAVIMFLMGVQVFITGILAEVIVKRAGSSWRISEVALQTATIEGQIIPLRASALNEQVDNIFFNDPQIVEDQAI
jgi:glycosyltransferase involved in cell wall biosynthesis